MNRRLLSSSVLVSLLCALSWLAIALEPRDSRNNEYSYEFRRGWSTVMKDHPEPTPTTEPSPTARPVVTPSPSPRTLLFLRFLRVCGLIVSAWYSVPSRALREQAVIHLDSAGHAHCPFSRRLSDCFCRLPNQLCTSAVSVFCLIEY
jgi:hypothetical protein